jgi:hypothetical protein
MSRTLDLQIGSSVLLHFSANIWYLGASRTVRHVQYVKFVRKWKRTFTYISPGLTDSWNLIRIFNHPTRARNTTVKELSCKCPFYIGLQTAVISWKNSPIPHEIIFSLSTPFPYFRLYTIALSCSSKLLNPSFSLPNRLFFMLASVKKSHPHPRGRKVT